MNGKKLNKKQKPATVESTKADIAKTEETLKIQKEIYEEHKEFVAAEDAYQMLKITNNGFERIKPEFKYELDPKAAEYVIIMLKNELKSLRAKRKGELMEAEYQITVLTESLKQLKEQLVRLEEVA